MLLSRTPTPDERRLLMRAEARYQGPQLPNGGRRSPQSFDQSQLAIGTKVELEHTSEPAIALEIAMAHLAEDPAYYVKLERMESTPNLGLTAVGAFMVLDAGLSVLLSTDRRPIVQAGRALRGIVGVGLFIAAWRR